MTKIRPQVKNANRHTQRGMQALERSIDEGGWIGAITVAADGETFDGSARVEKIAENGMLDEAITIDIDGSRPVILRRTDIPNASDPRAQKLGILANRVAELNLEWEPDVLTALAAEMDLSTLFYADELADLAMPSAAEPQEDAPVSIDDTKPTRCQPGDVWRVGRHTVACLDSTDRANVERLAKGVTFVVADPPYGIKIVQGGSVGGAKPITTNAARTSGRDKNIYHVNTYAPVIGDDSPDTAVAAALLLLELSSDATHVWWGANNYAYALPPSTCWLVWDKENTGNFADAELAWCSDDSAVRIFRHMWNGVCRDSEHGEARDHPNQKPIALFTWLYEKYGAIGDLILDPFLGSGPSLKAAEPLGRTVVGFELSPHYIDHILEWGESQGLPVERAE